MGTGNDLSRVLGWGKEHDLNKQPEDILQEIQVAEKVELDRYTEQYNLLNCFQYV